MLLTAELSLYPLANDYLPPIDDLIRDLSRRGDLVVRTNAMSTQVRGEYDAVMGAVSDALRASAERYGMQVLVCKFIPADLPIDA